jgi:leader peptidase (prepilin peptidase) / N-methyltransferase
VIEAAENNVRATFAMREIVLLSFLYAVSAYLLSQSQKPTIGVLAATVVLGVSLIALSAIDIETYRLPDALTLPLTLAGCVCVWPLAAEDIAWRAASAGVGFSVLFLFSKGFLRVRGYPGLGLGDAKLLAASGAWTGLAGLPSVVLIACALALGAVGAAMCTGRHVSLQSRLPFGPFLAFATWIVWFRGALV